MEEPEQLGRLASYMKPTERQHLKESSKKIQEEEAMAKKKKISHKQQRSGGNTPTCITSLSGVGIRRMH